MELIKDCPIYISDENFNVNKVMAELNSFLTFASLRGYSIRSKNKELERDEIMGKIWTFPPFFQIDIFSDEMEKKVVFNFHLNEKLILQNVDIFCRTYDEERGIKHWRIISEDKIILAIRDMINFI